MQAAAAAISEPDLSLLRRFTETGDPAAFAEIVRRYTGVVYAASHRILGDEARAQDVAQETFFRLLRQPKLVTQSLGGWLHREATHLAIDAKRSETSRRRREKSYFVNRDLLPRAGEPTWEEVSPYVDEALIDLPEPTRSLLVRHFLQGTPQAELAAELNTSPATVSRKIKSGVEDLQKLLRNKGIYVALIALSDFCTHQTAKAAPLRLMSELGKMQMVGPVGHGPPIGGSTIGASSGVAAAAAGGESKLVAALFAGLLTLIFVMALLLTWHVRSAAPVPPLRSHQIVIDNPSPSTPPILHSLGN